MVATLDEEGTLLRVIGWQRNQVSHILVVFVRILNLDWFLETLRIVSVDKVNMAIIPSCADHLVIVVLRHIPNISILHVVL